MSNSPLVNYIKLSPNMNAPRKNAIKKITIHHMAGNASIESVGEMFARPSRAASSNYGIGTDGRVAMYVEEKNRSWCSSSAENDHQAITIEVANDEVGGNWHVSDKALAKLIDLCVDICKRNGIEKLNYTGDKSGNLTMHKWFAATECPGPYLESKFPYIADEVNKRLGVTSSTPAPAPKPSESTTHKIGDIVQFAGGGVYKSSNAATAAVTRGASRCKVTNTYKGKHPYHLISEDGKGVYGWVDADKISAPTYKIGDIVQFAGGGVYKSSNAVTAAVTRGASRCKVTNTYKGKHPYHLISEDGKGVYGWVDADKIK